MKYIAFYTLIGSFIIAPAAQANNLEYMINPQPEDHQIPVEVIEVKKPFGSSNKQKEFVVKYKTPASHINQPVLAAGSNTVAPKYDHLLGH